MSDLDMLREWAHGLSQGPATVTVDVPAGDGMVIRYTIPHACVELSVECVAREVDPMPEDGVGLGEWYDRQPRDADGRLLAKEYEQVPGYRVTFSGDTRFRGGDDQMTRETVSD